MFTLATLARSSKRKETTRSAHERQRKIQVVRCRHVLISLDFKTKAFDASVGVLLPTLCHVYRTFPGQQALSASCLALSQQHRHMPWTHTLPCCNALLWTCGLNWSCVAQRFTNDACVQLHKMYWTR